MCSSFEEIFVLISESIKPNCGCSVFAIMGNGPMSKGISVGVQENNQETLKNLMDQIPADQKERIKAAIEAVATPRVDAVPAVAAVTPASEEKPAEPSAQK